MSISIRHENPAISTGIGVGREDAKDQANRAAAESYERSTDLAIDLAKPSPSDLDRLLATPSPLDRFAVDTARAESS